MTDHVDNWHKLARFDTNMQGELHANLLRNNGITVSLQSLSAIPGMNSGIVLWVEDTDLAEAQRILDTIPTDGAALLDEMSDADFDALSANQSNATQGNSIIDDNNGGND
ncbi:DUF2007 domain-containing protein [Psychrobacter sp. C 20.9]|uniref:DUF2007 domain-containing protein n=1 Tax=Psychrobacter sp. C 20.9 TaxID=1926477 RepID=UPI000B27A94E|nr:DUF2007 domain-containing protein [Psychrobacter sp. C 20.9]